jgi:hypothetical protein
MDCRVLGKPGWDDERRGGFLTALSSLTDELPSRSFLNDELSRRSRLRRIFSV